MQLKKRVILYSTRNYKFTHTLRNCSAPYYQRYALENLWQFKPCADSSRKLVRSQSTASSAEQAAVSFITLLIEKVGEVLAAATAGGVLHAARHNAGHGE